MIVRGCWLPRPLMSPRAVTVALVSGALGFETFENAATVVEMVDGTAGHGALDVLLSFAPVQSVCAALQAFYLIQRHFERGGDGDGDEDEDEDADADTEREGEDELGAGGLGGRGGGGRGGGGGGEEIQRAAEDFDAEGEEGEPRRNNPPGMCAVLLPAIALHGFVYWTERFTYILFRAYCPAGGREHDECGVSSGLLRCLLVYGTLAAAIVVFVRRLRDQERRISQGGFRALRSEPNLSGGLLSTRSYNPAQPRSSFPLRPVGQAKEDFKETSVVDQGMRDRLEEPREDFDEEFGEAGMVDEMFDEKIPAA